jgi:hypothetical protein
MECRIMQMLEQNIKGDEILKYVKNENLKNAGKSKKSRGVKHKLETNIKDF